MVQEECWMVTADLVEESELCRDHAEEEVEQV